MIQPLPVVGCGLLLVGGFAYNAYVARHIRRGTGDFMARFVALGVAGIIGVQTVALRGQTYTAAEWGALTLLFCACGGLGMAWGSWQRREQDGGA